MTRRLSGRERINIARPEDTPLFDAFIDEWLSSLLPSDILRLDVSQEPPDYDTSIQTILRHLE